MNKIKYILIVANLVAVLAYFTVEIIDKEQLLKNGTQVRLRLAPIDPRSLMQGDYMKLNYDILWYCSSDSDRYAVVSIPEGDFLRTQFDNEGISDNEVAIRVYYNQRRMATLSSDNYFFEEGSAYQYDDAKFALVVVDKRGDIYIKNLCDSLGNIIEPQSVIE